MPATCPGKCRSCCRITELHRFRKTPPWNSRRRYPLNNTAASSASPGLGSARAGSSSAWPRSMGRAWLAKPCASSIWSRRPPRWPAPQGPGPGRPSDLHRKRPQPSGRRDLGFKHRIARRETQWRAGLRSGSMWNPVGRFPGPATVSPGSTPTGRPGTTEPDNARNNETASAPSVSKLETVSSFPKSPTHSIEPWMSRQRADAFGQLFQRSAAERR